MSNRDLDDKKPQVKRTKTVERLAELLLEKKRKKEALRNEGDVRRQDSMRRKVEHEQIMRVSTNATTSEADFYSSSTPSSKHNTPPDLSTQYAEADLAPIPSGHIPYGLQPRDSVTRALDRPSGRMGDNDYLRRGSTEESRRGSTQENRAMTDEARRESLAAKRESLKMLMPQGGYLPNLSALPPDAQEKIYQQQIKQQERALRVQKLQEQLDQQQHNDTFVPTDGRQMRWGPTVGPPPPGAAAGEGLVRGLSRRMSRPLHMGRSMSRTMSRNLTRTMTRSAQLMNQASTQVKEAIREDKEKALNNAEIRRKHMQERTIKRIALLESNPSRKNILEAKKLQSSIDEQLERRLKGHPPYFARFVTLTQLIIIVLMIAFGDIAAFGMGTVTKHTTVDLLSGTTVQTIQRSKNPYYGPEVETLVQWGSKWSPCMRSDAMSEDAIETMREDEAGFGCCSTLSGDCGMMSESSCSDQGTFHGVGTSCSSLGGTCSNIKLHPCCYSIFGQCAVLSESHCKSLNGIFNKDKELCGESNCLDQACGMYSFAPKPYSSPNQFYRFLTSIFLHVGVIHFVMNAMGQYIMVGQIEFVAGFWRTAVMYLGSGACGFMISALFSSGTLSNGSSAAIYGMLGVETVDLFQTWRLLDKRWKQLGGLLFKLVIFLGIGTLPYIDNFAHVGGFLAGVVAGFGFLPFLVFDKFDGIRKRVLAVVFSIALIALIVGLLYEFYTTTDINCSFCHYVDCVPYTRNMCDSA